MLFLLLKWLNLKCHATQMTRTYNKQWQKRHLTVVMCSHSTADVPKQWMMLGVVTNEQWPKPWSFAFICCIHGIILPRDMGVTSHYKDPYKPISTMACHEGVERCSNVFCQMSCQHTWLMWVSCHDFRDRIQPTSLGTPQELKFAIIFQCTLVVVKWEDDNLLGCFKWAVSSNTAMDKILGTNGIWYGKNVPVFFSDSKFMYLLDTFHVQSVFFRKHVSFWCSRNALRTCGRHLNLARLSRWPPNDDNKVMIFLSHAGSMGMV